VSLSFLLSDDGNELNSAVNRQRTHPDASAGTLFAEHPHKNQEHRRGLDRASVSAPMPQSRDVKAG